MQVMRSRFQKTQDIRILISTDSNIRISSTELEAISPERKDQAIALPDGGYYGTLSVFHELHCLVRARYIPTAVRAKN